MPPPAAPIRARSRTVRFLIRDWALGGFFEVGLGHFCGLNAVEWWGSLLVVVVVVESEVEANLTTSFLMSLGLRLWGWVDMRLKVK